MIKPADQLTQDLEEEKVAAKASFDEALRYLSTCTVPVTRTKVAWLFRTLADDIENEACAVANSGGLVRG